MPFGAGTFDTPPQTGARSERSEGRRASPAVRPRPEPPEPPAEDAPRRAPSAKAGLESAPTAEVESGEPRAGRSRRRRGRRGRGRGERDARADERGSAGEAGTDEARAEVRSDEAFADEPERGERDHAQGETRPLPFEEEPPVAPRAEPDPAGFEERGDRVPPELMAASGPVDPSALPRRSGRAERRRRWQERRRRRRLGLPLDDLAPQGGGAPHPGAQSGVAQTGAPRQGQPHVVRPQGAGPQRGPMPPRERPQPNEVREVEGLFVLDKGNHGELRRREAEWLPSKDDVSVAPWQVQKYALRDGALVRGSYRRCQGRYRWELVDVQAVDGRDPREARNVPAFKGLVTIDPDFHYALGDGSGEVSLKVVDVICPIGRGQRGLIVAPPRSGKTILLQQIAKAVEKVYPDVHLMVLLIDERPEEATEWKRSVERGEVFVSTNDEPAKKHVELAEVVWRRARRLVELGKDVVLLLDSITRLGRAANNVWGSSGKTMSGGIDSRALERPKALFGSARNTEKAGSLTILGTTLVDTGSRMDQIIFEEFKGTGNMELVLSRKLSDRRIFPAIDLERSGTRKDEKLHSAKRLARVNTLRRVLMRMHFAEAMELLITKLGDVDKIDDFLQRFDIDPDAGDEGKQAVSPVRMRW